MEGLAGTRRFRTEGELARRSGEYNAQVAGFWVIGEIASMETFAEGPSIRELSRLTRRHGAGRWRKRKGQATVELESGEVRQVELHWYEAHGVGRKELKIKRYLD